MSWTLHVNIEKQKQLRLDNKTILLSYGMIMVKSNYESSYKKGHLDHPSHLLYASTCAS